MKKAGNKNKGVVKGTLSGVLISVLVHAAAFIVAGLLIVFTVTKKEEKKFEPPKQVERPKMKLKKPKVKIKKSSKPKSTTRIVTRVNRANMPDIQLPELGGMGGGLGGGGLDGFDMMPELGEVTLFGSGQSVGNDFVGTFYDLTRDRSGRPRAMNPTTYVKVMREFIVSNWDPKILAKYYKSPKKLYTTTFTIPTVLSQLAPLCFDEPNASTYCWVVHYKGQLVYPEDIKFRFWGVADDLLVIRVDGEVVLNGNYERHGNSDDTVHVTPMWRPYSSKSRSRWLGCSQAEISDWIELKANTPVEMEVVIGEVPGGLFQSLMMVEVEGEEYEFSAQANGPIMPIFKTSEIERDLVESIYRGMDPEDGIVTNGPVFCDYSIQQKTVQQEAPTPSGPEEKEELAEAVEPAMRTWNMADGKTFEAEYLTLLSRTVVVKNAKGKQTKISMDELSADDRIYVELMNPPRFNIDFSRTSVSVPPPPLSPYEGASQRPLQLSDYTYGAKLKQASTGVYNHELTVEYFAIGEEIDGDNFVLLDRRSESFIPAEAGKKQFSFFGEPVRLRAMAMRATAPVRGTKSGSFLIVVSDKRGKIVQHKAPKAWLFEIVDELRELPVGKHFDKTGRRVYPPRPNVNDRPDWY